MKSPVRVLVVPATPKPEEVKDCDTCKFKGYDGANGLLYVKCNLAIENFYNDPTCGITYQIPNRGLPPYREQPICKRWEAQPIELVVDKEADA
jgi:hypothetical protein